MTATIPDGYMSMPEVVGYLQTICRRVARAGPDRHAVTRVSQIDDGYEVTTNRQTWRCRTLVIASGACNIADRPVVCRRPAAIDRQHHADGLSQSGAAAGRRRDDRRSVRDRRAACPRDSGFGATRHALRGEHVRLPRVYRGRDIKWWMDVIGAMDVRYDEVDDINRARRLPSLQLIGTPERQSIDLNSLRKAGVEIVGRLVGLRDGKAQFSGSLANQCAMADLKMNRLLASIDTWISENGQDDSFDAPCRYEPTDIGAQTQAQPRP